VHWGKPDPEVYLTAAARVGVSPERCIVVEDAVAGVEGARRAGMKSIGVSRDGKHLPADVVVQSLELLEPDAFEKLDRSLLVGFGNRRPLAPMKFTSDSPLGPAESSSRKT
jgi:beta-phosphoglucomutase-like phosphatase (HAD superfamily)